MKKIKLIIFDLDGTLVDAYPAINASFNHTMKKLGYAQQKPQLIRRAVGWGDKQLLAPFVRQQDLTRALAIYRLHHKNSLGRKSRVLAGARGLLSKLKKKGYKLAVASNRPRKFSLILLKHLKLKGYFDYVLCADQLKQGKPHPEILKNILRRFALSAEAALYLGDMAIDAQAGRNAGIRTVMVSGGSSSIKELRQERPWRIVRRVGALLKLGL